MNIEINLNSFITGTENATVIPTPDLYTAYINLKNDIYSGILKVNIPTINDTVSTC